MKPQLEDHPPLIQSLVKYFYRLHPKGQPPKNRILCNTHCVYIWYGAGHWIAITQNYAEYGWKPDQKRPGRITYWKLFEPNLIPEATALIICQLNKQQQSSPPTTPTTT